MRGNSGMGAIFAQIRTFACGLMSLPFHTLLCAVPTSSTSVSSTTPSTGKIMHTFAYGLKSLPD